MSTVYIIRAALSPMPDVPILLHKKKNYLLVPCARQNIVNCPINNFTPLRPQISFLKALSREENNPQENFAELLEEYSFHEDTKGITLSTMSRVMEISNVLHMPLRFRVRKPDDKKIMKIEDIINLALPLREVQSSSTPSLSSQGKECQVVVLCSAPGSGKTSTAKEIANGFQKLNIDHQTLFLKECDDLLRTSSCNLSRLLGNLSLQNKKKSAIIFEGVDEMLPNRSRLFPKFLNEAMRHFGFVLITTRPEEKESIEEKLKGKKHLVWLSIEEFDSEESFTFLRQKLKGVVKDDVLGQICKDRIFPKTPQVLTMLATLLENDNMRRKLLSQHSYSEFLIYWHFITLHMKKVEKDHKPQDALKTLVEVAVKYLVKGERSLQLDQPRMKNINRVGLATFADNGIFSFIHQTYCEVLVCLGLLMPSEDIPDFTSELRTQVLYTPRFKQVVRFLDQSIQIAFKDEEFLVLKAENVSTVLQRALQDEKTRSKFLKLALRERHYSNLFAAFKLQSCETTRKILNDSLMSILQRPGLADENKEQFGELVDALVKNGACLVETFRSLDVKKQKGVLYYLTKSEKFELINGLVDVLKEEQLLLNYAFMCAVAIGPLEKVQQFQEMGADITASLDSSIPEYLGSVGDDALHVAVSNGQLEVFEYLFQRRQTADIINLKSESKHGFTPLLSAAWGDKYEMVMFLLNKPGIDVRAKDNFGQTCLHLAVESGNIKIVDELLKKELEDSYTSASKEEFNINVGDIYGKTPLHIAAENNLKTIAERLLKEENLIVDKKDKDGQTALHYAAEKNNKDICELLIEKNFEVNAQAKDGRTPLHLAAQWGSRDAVKMLLDNKNVLCNVKDNQDMTPLHCATFFSALGRPEDYVNIVNLLLPRSADV